MKPGTRVYVLGPMTGYKDDNRPAFRAATATLRALGMLVTSPDELDDKCPAERQTWEGYLERDLPWAVKAQAGVALPGWRQSAGASLEAANLAALGRPIYELVGKGLVQVPADRLPRIVHPV